MFPPFVRDGRRKRTENVLFSFPFIIKRKERISFRLFEKKKEKANVTFPSSFFSYRKRNDGSPFSLKKEKDEKTEERRQKEEGQKRKGTERREKEKEARKRRTEKRQRNMSQKGAFLTQESRKEARRWDSARKQGTGLRTPFFALCRR